MKTYPYPSGEGKVKWVSAHWLEKHLEDKNLMILDTQPNIHDYIQEHLQGAVYMNEGLLRVPLTQDRLSVDRLQLSLFHFLRK